MELEAHDGGAVGFLMAGTPAAEAPLPATPEH